VARGLNGLVPFGTVYYQDTTRAGVVFNSTYLNFIGAAPGSMVLAH